MYEHHILVIDDDLLSSHALKEHLGLEGYRVTVANSCAQAEELLGSTIHVDLVILDYLLPDGHGTDLLQTMATDHTLQKPFVVMSSAFIEPGSRSWEELRLRLPESVRSLIRAYVCKPYTFDSMDAMVNLILSSPSRKPTRTQEVRSGDYEPLYPTSSPRPEHQTS